MQKSLDCCEIAVTNEFIEGEDLLREKSNGVEVSMSKEKTANLRALFFDTPTILVYTSWSRNLVYMIIVRLPAF